MSIDFQNFTPYASLIGGVMIGLAALLLMLAHGPVSYTHLTLPTICSV